MKLSEAIRLGAVLRSQSTGTFFKRNTSCALGAAAEAIGLYAPGKRYYTNALKAAFPLLNKKVTCPILAPTHYPPTYFNPGSPIIRTVFETIWKLNDIQKLDREQIAAWVATVEAECDLRAGCDAEILAAIDDATADSIPEPQEQPEELPA